MKKETILPRVIGAAVTAAGLAAVIFTRKAAIADGAADADKLLFSVSLIALISGVLLLITSFVKTDTKTDIKTLTMAAMMAALCYIGFAFFKIDIPVPGSAEKSAFHLGNTFCVLAALVLGGLWGGLAGAVGMTLGDLFSGYVTSSPKTFFLKLCIGLITGFVAHKVLKLREEPKKEKVLWKTAVAASAGMLFNVIADPVVGYFYKRYLFDLPQDFAKTLAKISAGTTLVNAVVAVIAATLFYTALAPVLKRMMNE